MLDAQTGDILYADAHKKRPRQPTKILTAILAIELADLEEIATVSEKADRVGESSIYLNKGNKLKLRELLEGALIRSGNDACVAIAEQTAGSHDEFVRLMNLRAISLGAQNSNFVNTKGLPAKDHYSSAYDLALIARMP
jgi:D-alanyl-D-alanine carboxypeptidase (penicillin-binding protein 5/6)